jgi:hypothetical protein
MVELREASAQQGHRRRRRLHSGKVDDESSIVLERAADQQRSAEVPQRCIRVDSVRVLAQDFRP